MFGHSNHSVMSPVAKRSRHLSIPIFYRERQHWVKRVGVRQAPDRLPISDFVLTLDSQKCQFAAAFPRQLSGSTGFLRNHGSPIRNVIAVAAVETKMRIAGMKVSSAGSCGKPAEYRGSIITVRSGRGFRESFLILDDAGVVAWDEPGHPLLMRKPMVRKWEGPRNKYNRTGKRREEYCCQQVGNRHEHRRAEHHKD